MMPTLFFFFFSSRRRHTRLVSDWSSDVCSSDLGEKATDPVAAVERSYEKGITDEFIEPVTIVDDRGDPVGLIRDDDAVIFYNFRADRARETTMALTDPKLERPSRSLAPKNLHYATMTRYDKTFTLP